MKIDFYGITNHQGNIFRRNIHLVKSTREMSTIITFTKTFKFLGPLAEKDDSLAEFYRVQPLKFKTKTWVWKATKLER